jgi:peptidyl-prolyl cis-trans isomerase A (cyclophilin A)
VPGGEVAENGDFAHLRPTPFKPMSTSRLIPLFAMVALTACGGGGSGSPSYPAAPTFPPAPVSIPAAPTTTCSDAGKAAAAASTATNTVCMLTTHGEIVLELYADKAPVTVANFLQYVAAKRYENTLLHRVVAGFVVQGGGFTGDWTHIPTYAPIVLESDKGLSNVKGTIAMARQDGTNTTTATSEFFFNVVDNHACLDIRPTAPNCDQNGYAVFGKVIAGLDTLDKITALKVDYFAAPTVPTATFWVQQLK